MGTVWPGLCSGLDNGGKDLYGAVVKGCSTTKIGSGAMRHKKGLR